MPPKIPPCSLSSRLALVLAACFLFTLAACDTFTHDETAQQSASTELVTAAQKWFDTQTASLGKSGDDALRRFYPDWDKGTLVTTDDGQRALVTTVWRDAQVRYDARVYFLRVLAVVLDADGSVTHGHIVEFVSPDSIAHDAGPSLVRHWLADAAYAQPMKVATRSVTHAFERGAFYAPGADPVAFEIERKPCEIGGLGKVMATEMCDVVSVPIGQVCMGWEMDGSDEQCWPRWGEQWTCYEEGDGGGTGSSGGTGGYGGTSGSGSTGDPGYNQPQPQPEKVPVIGPTETKKSLEEMMQEKCDVAPKDQDFNYERNIADFLFGGMGTGRVDRFLTSNGSVNPFGFDGYMTLNYDYNGNRLNGYVDVVMEAKFTGTSPMDSEERFDQAIAHIDFLASENARYKRDYPASHYYGPGPVYIIVSQNTMPDNPGHPDPTRREDRDWWIGKRDSGSGIDYHQAILDHANDKGVAVLHMKISNQPLLAGKSYRNIVFRSLNDFPLLQTELTDWLGRATDALPKDMTIETIAPMFWDCDAHTQGRDRAPGDPRI